MNITLHWGDGEGEFAPPLHITAPPGQSLAEALWLNPATAGKISPPPLCSGLGRCGRCRVRFLTNIPTPLKEDGEILSPAALDAGWRLACAHKISPRSLDAEILLAPTPPPRRRVLPPAKDWDADKDSLLLAVDLGTTSLHWRALRLAESGLRLAKPGLRLAESGLRLVEPGLPGTQAIEYTQNPEDTQNPGVDTGDKASQKGQALLVAEGQEINPQMGAGSDVMSRLAHARTPQGCAALAERVYASLRGIVAALPAPVREICVAANTAMTAILLQKDVRGLAHAPYSLPLAGGESVRVAGLPPLYIPPLPAPFVGGDISAGLALLLHEHAPRYPFLLADMGTNGEFLLALAPHKALVTSVPLGPALEGIGLTFGAMAEPGVICRYSLQATGLVPHSLPGEALLPAQNSRLGPWLGSERGPGLPRLSPAGAGLAERAQDSDPPLLPASAAFSQLVQQTHEQGQEKEGAQAGASGICGTGYLSLLHALLRAQVLRPDGSFCHAPASALGARLSSLFTEVQAQPRLQLGGGLYLTARDVEEILKVKAAFSLAWESLLRAAGLRVDELQHIYLAGALGEHVLPADLEALGILPQGAGHRLQAVGNSSLHGAALLLTTPCWRAELALWAQGCQVLDLTTAPDFTEQYLRHMRFA